MTGDMAEMRPSRLSHLHTNTPVFYVTFCSYHRRPVLANRAVHLAFISFCKTARMYGVTVGRYTIMPDHIHLFAAFGPESLSVSSWVKSLKNSLSKTLTARNERPPHFQPGFFDHVLRNAESYSRKADYMYMNPVRAGFVERPEDWEFTGEICELDNPL
jgi:putative transposase